MVAHNSKQNSVDKADPAHAVICPSIDASTPDRWIDAAYDELRSLASAVLRSHRPGQTIRTTALVNEAYLRLADKEGFEGRDHFFGIAALAMRSILVDYARRRSALKRGGPADAPRRSRLLLDEVVQELSRREVDLLALDEALTRLATLDARKARVVELRFFAGLDIERTAALLGVGHATIERDWRFARAWLRRELLGDAR